MTISETMLPPPTDEFENFSKPTDKDPFQRLCLACRRGDVKAVQSLISFEKVNVNAVDGYDYPPLTLVHLLAALGADINTDSFSGKQGESLWPLRRRQASTRERRRV